MSATDKWRDEGVQEVNERQTVEQTHALSDQDVETLDAELKTIYSDQCYLLTFAKRFSAWYPLHPSDYSHYSLLKGDPSLVMNWLTAHSGIKEFVTMKPYHVAALVPQIEIYKVVYSGIDDTVGTDYMFSFPTFTQYDSTSAGSMVSDRFDRGDGAGIKSISYTLEGKNPATGHIVDLNAAFKFQDIKYMFHRQDVGGGQMLSFSDLITYPASRGGPPSSENKPPPPKLIQPDSFRIKIVVGWQDPGNNELFTKSMRKAVKNTKTVLMLDMVDYTIDFAEDGSVDLQVHYAGSIETAYGSHAANILSVSSGLQQNLKNTEEKIASLQKEKTELETSKQSILNEEEKRLTIEDGKDGTQNQTSAQHRKEAEKAFDDDLAKRSNKIVKLQNSMRQAKIRDFFKGIGQAKIYYFDLSEGDINILNQAYSVVRRVMGNKDATQTAADALAQLAGEQVNQVRQAEAIVADMQGRVNVHSGGQDVDVTAQAQAELDGHAQAQHDRNVNGATIDMDKARKSRRLKLLKENSVWDYGSPGAGMRRVAYIKLGDVINNMLEKINPTLETEQKMPNLVTLLGEIRFSDALTQKTVHMNIAEMPVEIKLFNNFLVDKIIGEGLAAYSFFNFLEDLLTELVYAAFDSCLAAGKNMSIDLSTLPVTSTMTVKGVPLIKKGEIVDAVKIAHLKGGLLSDGYTGVKRSSNYMILFGSSYSPDRALKGDYEHDLKNKIYHFFLGGPDGGLLKKITFGRINNPKWKVALYAANKSENEDSGKEAGTIRPEMFKANLKLVGNPLFNLGQKFYIDSALLDGGNSGIHRLAFGGYYEVIKLTNSITPARYETEITAVMTVPDWQVGPDKVPDTSAESVSDAINQDASGDTTSGQLDKKDKK